MVEEGGMLRADKLTPGFSTSSTGSKFRNLVKELKNIEKNGYFLFCFCFGCLFVWSNFFIFASQRSEL